jgi:hypothetical protein
VAVTAANGDVEARRADRGQAWMLLLFVVVAIVAATVGIAQLGAELVHRARARAAADAAALAGTTGGRVAAARIAQRNGAVLVSYRSVGELVVVEVVVEGARAAAAASDAP